MSSIAISKSRRRLINKLIVSHGQLAAHLVHAARRINSEALAEFAVLCLEWDISLDHAIELVGEGLRELECDGGVLVLTDLFGATPSNACRPFLEKGVAEMVTGVNLPMVMRLGTLLNQPADLSELAGWLREKTVKGILHFNGGSKGAIPKDSHG